MSSNAEQRMDVLEVVEVVEACNAGVGRHVRGLCENLASQGHRLMVAYSPYRTDEAFEQFIVSWQDKVRFIPIKVGREVSPVSDLQGILELLHVVRREGPFDVIHGHSSKAGVLARITGRLLSIPTLYTPHSLILSSPEISRLEAITYASVERMLGYWATSKIIAVSEDEREFILKHKLAPDDRIAVIPNAIDDQHLQWLPETKAPENLNQRPLTFGAAMRFSAQKAPMNLVKAFVSLSDSLPEIPMRLVIAGDGELFPEVREWVARSGSGSKISLLGWQASTREILRDLDVFVVSSLYEGFSYSILEAMAAGLPIVSTNVFGTKETISRVPGNVVVPAGSPDSLAVGLRRMATLADPESLRKSFRRLGQNNHDYVGTHFRQSEITQRILKTYHEVAGKDENDISTYLE